jgi:CubicO group peptidase (beta-lactamase class C family)
MGRGQSLYFPPLTGDTWDTIQPSSLGWCEDRIDSMYDLLEDNNTKAFIILKDGKIVLEKYFGTFVQDSVWYWASAGKSLTSFLVGLAQEDGFLTIADTTSSYLGAGWTGCTTEEEEKITLRHQLTMTSGLDDYVPDPYCTLDTCLQYKADAGTRWAYHNAPYTLLDGVIEEATGQTLNAYFNQKVRVSTGITGIFLPSGYNNVFYSKPRSMARYGLMILNNGNWNGNQIMTDAAYFNSMVNTSQDMNLSYGYLWWLNGKASYMVPSLQIVFPGSLMPHAPNDMVMALGKNGQYINVVPSQNLVLIRMGNAPDGSAVPVTLNDKIWEHINGLDCGTTSTSAADQPASLDVYPNPAKDHFSVLLPGQSFTLSIYDVRGNIIMQRLDCFDHEEVQEEMMPGMYYIKLAAGGNTYFRKIILAL